MDFLKLFGAVFLANVLSFFVIVGYIQQRTEMEVAAALEAFQASIKQSEAASARYRAEAESKRVEAERMRQADERRKLSDIQSMEMTKIAKEKAWKAFYQAPAYCADPADFEVLKTCTNSEMRKRKEFEQQWSRRDVLRIR